MTTTVSYTAIAAEVPKG